MTKAETPKRAKKMKIDPKGPGSEPADAKPVLDELKAQMEPFNAALRAHLVEVGAAEPERSEEVALFADQLAAAQLPEVQETKEITAELLRESRQHKRKDFGDLDELAANIAANGLLEPLIVTPGEEGRFIIVAGHRRFRAIEQLGWKAIRCEVRELTEAQIDLAQAAENKGRKDFNAIEEAEEVGKLREHGLTDEQIAAKFGKSKGWVYGRQRIRNLIPEAKKMLTDGILPPSLGEALGRRDHEVQASALAGLKAIAFDGGPIPLRPGLNYIQRELTITLKGAPFDQKDPMLVADAGACTGCKFKSGNRVGLFEEAGNAHDVCTRPACYRAKADAAWVQTAKKYADQGAQVLTAADTSKVFQFDEHLFYNGPWVPANAPAVDDPKKRTYKQLLSKVPAEKRPQLTVVPTAKMKPVALYDLKATLEALGNIGESWAKKTAVDHGVKPKATPAEKKAKAEQKTKLSVYQRVISEVADKIEVSKLNLFVLRAIAHVVVDSLDGAITALVTERWELKPSSLEKWIDEKATRDQVVAFTVELCLLDQVEKPLGKSYPAELRELAKSFGVNLDKLDKLVREESEKEAKP